MCWFPWTGLCHFGAPLACSTDPVEGIFFRGRRFHDRAPVYSEEEAFKQSVECITGPVTKLISSKGMPAVYEALDDEGKKIFEKASGLLSQEKNEKKRSAVRCGKKSSPHHTSWLLLLLRVETFAVGAKASSRAFARVTS